jgi:uncharacterized membrane protein YkoI
MKRLVLILLVIGISTLFPLYPGFAENKDVEAAKLSQNQAAMSVIPMSIVLQNLRMNGYYLVSKVELDNGVFAIDTLTPQGKAVSVLMQAHTGEIIQPKQNPAPHITLEEAVKRVEGSGYHDIFKVEYSGSKYIIRAYDQKNKKVKLKVNGNTGDLSTSWF